MSRINTTSKLASFWRFSITVCSLPSASTVTGHSSPATRHYLHIHWPLTSGHCYPATRHDLPAVRQTSGIGLRRPTPAGFCLPQTAGLPKTERGPISTSGPSLFSMSPNQAIVMKKTILFFPLAVAQLLTVLSWPLRSMPPAPGVPAGWLSVAMPVFSLVFLISRNSPKQLGMVSPELLLLPIRPGRLRKHLAAGGGVLKVPRKQLRSGPRRGLDRLVLGDSRRVSTGRR